MLKVAPLSAFVAALALTGCAGATKPANPGPSNAVVAGELGAVGLGQPVRVGTAIVTPLELLEDSRCPAGVECVWAGTVRVRAAVQDSDRREVVALALGEPHRLRYMAVFLAEVKPPPATSPEIPKCDYRFVFAQMPLD